MHRKSEINWAFKLHVKNILAPKYRQLQLFLTEYLLYINQ